MATISTLGIKRSLGKNIYHAFIHAGLEEMLMDSIRIRAHPHAAGAKKQTR
jgi:hypothetical protein